MIRPQGYLAQGGSLEHSLKELLDKILNYLQKYYQNTQEIQRILISPKNFDSLNGLVRTIKDYFDLLCEKIDLNILLRKEKKTSNNIEVDSDYDKLEQNIQKYEKEIRQHIRIEQQMKLYAESVQAKLDECEQQKQELIDSNRKLVAELKKGNEQKSLKSSQQQEEYNKLLKELEKKDSKIIELTSNQELQTKELNSLKNIMKKMTENVVKPQPLNLVSNKLRSRQISVTKDISSTTQQLSGGHDKQTIQAFSPVEQLLFNRQENLLKVDEPEISNDQSNLDSVLKLVKSNIRSSECHLEWEKVIGKVNLKKYIFLRFIIQREVAKNIVNHQNLTVKNNINTEGIKFKIKLLYQQPDHRAPNNQDLRPIKNLGIKKQKQTINLLVHLTKSESQQNLFKQIIDNQVFEVKYSNKLKK